MNHRPSTRQLSFPANGILARGLLCVCCLGFGLPTCPDVLADDWPQTLGPTRDGSSTTRNLARDWPEQIQPKWSISLGSGYAGPAVVGSRVFVPHRLADREILSAYDLTSGKQVWKTSWEATYRGGLNADKGPRCVPTIAGDKAVVYGAAGDLHCVRITDGKMLWGRQLRAEYDADDGFFGAASAPLIVGDIVVICLGGRRAGVVAVELATGKTRWTSTSYEASYAAPIDVSTGSKRRILVVTRLNTLLMDADTGKVLANVDFGEAGPTVNAATPILVSQNRVLLTASYNIGAALFKLNGDQLIEEFRESRLLGSQYNTPVIVNDKLIGIHGREDGTARMRAIDMPSKQILWDKGGYRPAHLISVGTQVLALTIEGRLELIDGSADDFRLIASTSLPRGTYLALPALVNKQLIARANRGASESELMLFELP